MELSPGSGGCGSGGASSRRHVRPSRRRLRNHDATSITGGAASTTRRRRETPHSTTPSIPRCQGGWRQLEYTRVTISPSAPSADGGSARRGPTARARTDCDPSQSKGHTIRGWRTGQDTPGPSRAPEPVRPSTIQGSNSLVHPRDGGPERSARALMLPRYRPDHAQSPLLTRHTSGGRPVKELGHSSCPGIGLPRPAHHSSFSGRRAGK